MHQSANHCGFNGSRTLFALVHNNSVRIYNVHSGALERTLTPPNSMSHAVNVVCWGEVAGSDVVALGCNSGSVFVWDVKSEAQLYEAVLPTPVESVTFDAASQLYVATKQRLRVVTFGAGAPVESEADLPKGTNTIAVHNGNVVVGAKKLCVVKAEKGAKKFPVLLKYTGHAGVAAQVRFVDDARFVSFADEEQYVSLWNCDEAAAGKDVKRPPAHSFQLLNKPLAVDVVAKDVMCLTENGAIQIFDLEKDASSVVKSHTVDAESAASILSSCFLDANDILVAKGTLAAPFFERVSVKANGKYVANVSIDLTGTDVSILDPSKQKTSKKRRNLDDATPIAGETVNEDVIERTISKIDQLGFKKAELLRRQNADPTKEKIRLTQPLQQALSTKDTKQLNDLLSEGIKRNVIDVTVKALERIPALQLLRECVKRFQNKSNAATDMLPWIRSVLALHPQHLLSLPNLDAMLGPLQSVIESHLSTYHQLALMKGRLDVVIGRSETLRSSGLREKGQPLRTVNEDDVRRAHALLPLGEFEGAAVADLNEAMDDEDEEEDDELGAFLREQGLLPQDGDAADEQNGMALDSDEDDEEDEEDEDEDDEEGEEPSEESE